MPISAPNATYVPKQNQVLKWKWNYLNKIIDFHICEHSTQDYREKDPERVGTLDQLEPMGPPRAESISWPKNAGGCTPPKKD